MNWQIRWWNTNTNTQSQILSNTIHHICIREYKYVFVPQPWRLLQLFRPSSHDLTRLEGYPSSGRKLTWSLYLRRDPNTRLPTTAQSPWPVFAGRSCLSTSWWVRSIDICRRGVSSSLNNTASGKACHVTPSSLALIMTSTQCFRPTNRWLCQCLRNYIGTSAFADVSYSMADVEAKFFV